MRGWGPGWPDCRRGGLISEISVSRPSDGHVFKARVRKELKDLVGFLLAAHMQIDEIRRRDEPGGGLGSYSCRKIKRSDPAKPSWHSWGLALDIDSRGNPMLNKGQAFVSRQDPDVVDLWESAGFKSGTRWDPSDSMHFEYLFRPEDVAADLVRAQAAFLRLRSNGQAGIQATERPQLRQGDRGEHVETLQKRLNAHGADPQLAEDGVFGSRTAKAVRAFKARMGLRANPIVGRRAWAALDANPNPFTD